MNFFDPIHLIVVSLLPALVFFGMYCFWWYSGRDEDANKSIPVEFSPPDELSPIELSVLLNEGLTGKSVVAMIIDLAARGYIEIREIPGVMLNQDYQFTQTKAMRHEEPTVVSDRRQIEKLLEGNKVGREVRRDLSLFFKSQSLPVNDSELNRFEKAFMESLFEYHYFTTPSLSQLPENVSWAVEWLNKSVTADLAERGYFKGDPFIERKQFVWIYGFILLAALIFMFKDLAVTISLLVSLAIISVMAKIMPARTSSGSKAIRHSLGYKRYVDMVEGKRIASLPVEDPALFGRLYAYSLVLNSTDDWLHKVQVMNTKRPPWFIVQDHEGDEISAVDLIHKLDHFSRTAESIFDPGLEKARQTPDTAIRLTKGL